MKANKKGAPLESAGSQGAPSKNQNKLTTSPTESQEGNSAEAQRQRLLQYLQEHGSVTTCEARRLLDIMHPAARIMELRRDQDIDLVWINDLSEAGKAHRVGKYLLGGKHDR